MKTITFLILFSAILTINANSQYVTDYRVGMFSTANEPWFYNTTTYGYLDDLGVNQVIKYGYHKDNDDTHYEGGFKDVFDSYKDNVSGLITEIVSIQGRQLLIDREKATRPAYGQQVIRFF